MRAGRTTTARSAWPANRKLKDAGFGAGGRHDGDAHQGPIHKIYKDHFQDAGFDVDVIKNQGAGAAMMRVEAARRIFPRCWFNETTTQAGLEALGFYHEKRDEVRNIGMGPEHD